MCIGFDDMNMRSMSCRIPFAERCSLSLCSGYEMMSNHPRRAVEILHLRSTHITTHNCEYFVSFALLQWVDDMADAGADQYTFHLEATSELLWLMLIVVCATCVFTNVCSYIIAH